MWVRLSKSCICLSLKHCCTRMLEKKNAFYIPLKKLIFGDVKDSAGLGSQDLQLKEARVETRQRIDVMLHGCEVKCLVFVQWFRDFKKRR